VEYAVRSLSQLNLACTALGLQGFLNGWVRKEGYEFVSVVVLDDDWLVVLKKEDRLRRTAG
jgi:hypothetical protein